MKTIFELAPKPSDAIKAMWQGLIEQSKREDFVINMQSFGGYSTFQGICFGCAATCSIQQLSGVNFEMSNSHSIVDVSKRSKLLKIEMDSLNRFEACIDEFRNGDLTYLLDFYDRNTELNIVYDEFPPDINFPDILMDDDDWKHQEPQVNKIIKFLEENDL